MERMMFTSSRLRLARLAVVLAVSAIACGGSSGPSAPSTPVDVAGLWTGFLQITSVSGGDCLGPTLNALAGSRQMYTLQVTQNGGALTAVATQTVTGSSTQFSGTAGTTSIALNETSSTAA